MPPVAALSRAAPTCTAWGSRIAAWSAIEEAVASGRPLGYRAPFTSSARPAGPPPDKITLFRPTPARAETFTTLESLARRIHQLRGRAALRQERRAWTHAGSRTFPAFNLYAVGDDGAETWLGTAVIQGRDFDPLQRALERLQPQDA